VTHIDVLSRLENVRRCGEEYTALCPAHRDSKNSLSVGWSPSGLVLLYCHAGCTFEAICAALNLPVSSARSDYYLAFPSCRADGVERAKRNSEVARRIWRESRAADGTIVEHYLRSRAITIRPPASLRFHPNLRHPTGVYAPAMVAAVQCDSEIVAIHRTFLKSDGSGKAPLDPPKALLGPAKGAAIRFAKAAEALALTEGIETGLSVMQACPGLAIWCAISSSLLPHIHLPVCVREVIIAIDADQAGERAAREAAETFVNEGLRVRIARPESGLDFNDYLKTKSAT
jgi:putative DNA primase/helicase